VKLLIDECLSPRLAKRAHERGYGHASHVTWIGATGLKDWELKPLILAGDWTFVTKNSVDFRGPADAPGVKGQYADVAIHAGLICLNAVGAMPLPVQLELFDILLDEVDENADLVNQVLEATLTEADEIRILRYALPAENLSGSN
jgi:Domain of unknown function (DUF5615)